MFLNIICLSVCMSVYPSAYILFLFSFHVHLSALVASKRIYNLKILTIFARNSYSLKTQNVHALKIWHALKVKANLPRFSTGAADKNIQT